jgi:glycosyltransferase involved in cell wall biosynthesis
VVATRDRPDDLRRLLASLARQRTGRAFEVVVVDDGSEPPVALDGARPNVRVVRGPAAGPARARNRGVAASAGEVVLFTDDDVEPGPGWVEAACGFLERHPACLGVEGATATAPYDYLRAHSVESTRPGAYLTANVAYRRGALDAVGGFFEDWPRPACEDRDLAFRVLDLGPIGFEPAMRVLHHPRPLSLRGFARRALLLESDIVCFRRHRRRFGREAYIPARLFPLFHVGLAWWSRLRADRARLARSPGRAARFAAAFALQAAVAVGIALRPRAGRPRWRRPPPRATG